MSINASIHFETPVRILPLRGSSVVRQAAYASGRSTTVQAVASSPPFLTDLWLHRGIWFTPLACEVIFFLCALHLSLILARIMEFGVIGWQDWLPIMLGAAVYAIGKVEVEKKELFMTRFVAASGAGGLMLMAILVMTLITVIAPGLLGAMGLNRRMVLILPLAIFIMREAMLIRASRFAPSMASLSLRHNNPVGVIVRLREKLHYWMH